MTSHDPSRDKLLQALFQDGDAAVRAQSLARDGARRVRRRRALQGGGSALGAVCAVLCMVLIFGSSRQLPSPVRISEIERRQDKGVHNEDKIERIGDDELMWALRDRPVLFVTDASVGRRVVFLDQIQPR